MTRPDDWEELNALADGELARPARLRLRLRLATEPDLRRAYGDILGLKSRLGTLAPAVAPRPVRRTARPRAAAAVLVALALLGGGAWMREARGLPTPAELHATLSDAEPGRPAGLDPGAALDLSGSNLALVAIRRARITQGAVAAWHYRGPSGCALTILSGPDLAAAPGPLVHHWRAGGTGFLILAQGMDPRRFRAVARFAEAETRRDGPRDDLLTALRDRTKTARRCA